MCGIVGYFGLRFSDVEAQHFLRGMADSIFYRGPDDDGYMSGQLAGLGMRRLSIIDLAKGRQPISSLNKKQHIVFNGEIYNFQEIRKNLQTAGVVFNTESDTEVILYLYLKYGKNCVHYLNGMFAFAIYDEEKEELFLARDRMGVKPLYYFWNGEYLIFGSEIKAIMASGHVAREVNLRSIWNYLTFRYVPGPETIWENVFKLPPAHVLKISKGDREPKVERYWDIPYGDRSPLTNEADYFDEFQSLFLDSVRLRLIADVPVGILLSGGIDSSAVAAAVAQQHNSRMSSFSVAFRGATDINELPYAREMASAAGLEYNEIVIGQEDLLDFLPQMVYITDEPLGDMATVPLYYVSRLAAQKVKVVLSGEGSDEILGGYDFDRFVKEFDDQILKNKKPPSFLNTIVAKITKQMQPDLTKLNPPPHMTNYLSSEQKSKLMKNETFHDSMNFVRRHIDKVSTRDPLDQILYAYCQDWLVEDLLMKADRASMANSIELRTPFLDYRLVEWAARAPSKVKVGRGHEGEYETKRPLRVFAKGRIPQGIIDRPKMGFPVPVYNWLSTGLNAWVNELFSSPNEPIFSFLDRELVLAQINLGTKTKSPQIEKHRLWNLIILNLWMREWLQP